MKPLGWIIIIVLVVVIILVLILAFKPKKDKRKNGDNENAGNTDQQCINIQAEMDLLVQEIAELQNKVDAEFIPNSEDVVTLEIKKGALQQLNIRYEAICS